jgi:hypothetical protein
VLVAVGCTSGDDDGAPTTSTTALAPLPDDGIVVVEEWFDDPKTRWVVQGDSPVAAEPGPVGGIVVLVPEGAEPGDDEAVVISANPRDVVEPGVDLSGFLPLGTPCGATSVVVGSPGGLLRVASRATPLADLDQIGLALDVDAAGDVVVGDLDGWTEAGRLPAGWTTPPDGSRAMVEAGRFHVWATARRLAPTEHVAVEALVCDEPLADLVPPASEPDDYFEAAARRTVEIGGAQATVGALGTYWFAAFTDDRLLLLDVYVLRGEVDDLLVRLLGGMDALPVDEFDARREAFEAQRGDEAAEAFTDPLPAGEAVVAEGTLDGIRWVVHTATDLEAGPVACIDAVRFPDDTQHANHGIFTHVGCPVDTSGAPGLAFGYSGGNAQTLLALAQVPASAATVEVVGGGDVSSQLVDDVRGRRYLVLRLRGRPAANPMPRVAGEDAATLLLTSGGTATVTVRDADGTVVAQDTIGD